jgi:DNA-binding NarL/FixJ family response regulator
LIGCIAVSWGSSIMTALNRRRAVNFIRENIVRKKDDPSRLFSIREKQVVDLVVQGTTNQQIARKLDISEKMVEKILTRVYRKTKTQCRTELAVWILSKRS